jgi:DNA helicase-2/ATP-dependent DNA helicase PcrA
VEAAVALTKQQVSAVNHTAGNLQLIACAGSGKTEVVARHIANLLSPRADGGAGMVPANVIAFTFTEKAAAELKQRVRQRCSERLPGLVGMADMYVGTIHGFCLDLMKTQVPDFLKYDVLNEVQQSLLINRNSSKSGLTSTTTLAGQALRRYIDANLYIQTLAILRESIVKPKALAGNSVVAGLESYRALLHEKGYFDYSSIIEEAVNAIAKNKALRAHIAQRLKVIIVDEYQDLNPIQEKLIRLLHDVGCHVKVVGDDDQTIYQWRGSDAGNILQFTSRYPKVETIRLEENFRSSKGITDVARKVISKNAVRLEKTMESAGLQTYEVGDITALQFGSPDEEADHIAETCAALRGTLINDGEGTRAISWSDMAVLMRITAMGEPIRASLRRKGIPFVSVGMNTLFDAPEAEAARQLFYLMVDQASTKAVVSAWEAADLGIKSKVLATAVDEAKKTREKMKVEDEEVRFSVYNIQRQYIGFLERIALREELVPNGRGEVVFYNLAKFSQAISDFETIYFHSRPVQKYQSFAGFLQHQAAEVYGEAVGAEEKFVSPDAVQLLTIHRAKGLQWPVVFVPQLVRNRFPSARHGGRTVWHVIPPAAVDGQARFLGSVEDERRLFYVAVTRSQKHLHLSTAPTPGNKRNVAPSEFWYDVLESKHVKRTPQDYGKRVRKKPTPKASVSDVSLSFSDMKYFFECPYQFKLRTLYGFNAPLDEALGYGKSLHDALAEIHGRAIEGEKIDSKMAPELVARHLRVPFAYPTLRETMQKSATKTVAEYIRARQSEFSKLELSEKAIEVALEGGVSVNGRIDLVRRRDTNEIAIVDLKSTERAQAEELTDAQLHIYALGYRELTGHDADFVETYELDTQTRKPRAVDEQLIESVKARVQATAAALRSNAFPAKPAQAKCSKCDFRRMCSAGIKHASL